jgi:hypothetical protein
MVSSLEKRRAKSGYLDRSCILQSGVQQCTVFTMPQTSLHMPAGVCQTLSSTPGEATTPPWRHLAHLAHLAHLKHLVPIRCLARRSETWRPCMCAHIRSFLICFFMCHAAAARSDCYTLFSRSLAQQICADSQHQFLAVDRGVDDVVAHAHSHAMPITAPLCLGRSSPFPMLILCRYHNKRTLTATTRMNTQALIIRKPRKEVDRLTRKTRDRALDMDPLTKNFSVRL